MAVYERFEDLPVWDEAARLNNSALDLLQSQKLLLGPGWRFQFERAALSVSNNIAEGFERLTPNELRNFLVIARGGRRGSQIDGGSSHEAPGNAAARFSAPGD
jgi:hypothetical protein